jgi:hypothetical protein
VCISWTNKEFNWWDLRFSQLCCLPCSVVDSYQSLEESHCLCLSDRRDEWEDPADGGNRLLQHIRYQSTKLCHNIVCFLLGNSPASEFYMPLYLPAYEDGTDSVLKRRHIKFRRWGITQKKTYNIQNLARVWNQEYDVCHIIQEDQNIT